MLHQATCVAIGARGVLIEGPPGSGKSSLALALLDRGARLVGDDGVLLAVRAQRLYAAPAPVTAGLLEIRNLGLVRQEPLGEVAIALVVQLDAAAPRFIERAERVCRCGIDLPQIRLWPDSPVLALRTEAALAHYGAHYGE